MRYALDPFNNRVAASPDSGDCTCPLCGSQVIAKCGSIVIWHWSHLKRSDCDTWSEGETEWHRGWKRLVSPVAQEVCMGPHRADIVGNRGRVIELQHSAISPEEIEAREEFYKNMIWLFDVAEFRDNLAFSKKKDGEAYRSFRWKWPRKSQFAISLPLFWDVPSIRYRPCAKAEYKTIPAFVFEVKKFHDNGNG